MNAGYLCGRLMAILERLQQTALGDVNAGVVDRYFGAASASPRLVFMRLLKNRGHYVRKADEDDARGRTARWLDRQLDEVAAGFSPSAGGFPASLSLEEQGLFILGYHQQRHWLWLSREERERRETGSVADVP
jgi:CRISPR-associated protein Csd1